MESEAQPKAKSTFVCEYCQKEFTLKCNLKAHIKIHLLKSDFKCSICDYNTNFKKHLKQHMQTHTKERPYKCPLPNCNMTFRQPAGLYQHQMVHRKGDESLLKFNCSNCPYKSSRRGDLKKHVDAIHSTEKPFSCNLCPYKAKLKWCVTEHVKRVHSTLRPFKCPHTNCVYSGKVRNDLTRHLRKHHSEQPLICPILNSTRQINGEELLFTCPQCVYSSRHLDDVMVHSQGHEIKTGVLDSSNSSLKPGATFEVASSEVTHVQWSVDWGKIVYQTMGDVDGQTPASSTRVIIKVENGS